MPPTAIVQSAAIELLSRLTETLAIPFTLTDQGGSVIASTAGRPTGQVDAYAAMVARQGQIFELGEDQLRAPDQVAAYSPAAEHLGLLPPAPGVYVPVKMGDENAAVLFARGEIADVRTKAVIAAAAAGLALEFSAAATLSMQQSLGPDLALRALLRGTRSEATQATVLVKVAGWNLLTPRVALVMVPATPAIHLPETGSALLRDALLTTAPGTPSGQLDSDQLVALPALPQLETEQPIAALAAQIEQQLRNAALPVIVGLGETHIDLPILPGLRRSYREALFSAQWARRLGAQQGVHSLRSLGPLAFLTPGARARERIAQRTLEPLRAAPDILATVNAFLDSDLSVEATAKRTGQHRHTVRAHLQRARELTGLDPRILSDALQLRLAVLLSPIQTV